jgi:hypothetical protein
MRAEGSGIGGPPERNERLAPFTNVVTLGMEAAKGAGVVSRKERLASRFCADSTNCEGLRPIAGAGGFDSALLHQGPSICSVDDRLSPGVIRVIRRLYIGSGTR